MTSACLPTTVLQEMVTICESFGKEHNLIFSTDHNPAKSKTKCVMFCGNNSSNYPVPVLLDGKQLPWVQKAEHLGHIFDQNLSMESDSYRARASFMILEIDWLSDCRDSLHFAESQQWVQAIQFYCSDAYGALLYDFRSDYANSLFKAWNIQVRLAWNVPLTTHTWLVEGYFCDKMQSWKIRSWADIQSLWRNCYTHPAKKFGFWVEFYSVLEGHSWTEMYTILAVSQMLIFWNIHITSTSSCYQDSQSQLVINGDLAFCQLC